MRRRTNFFFNDGLQANGVKTLRYKGDIEYQQHKPLVYLSKSRLMTCMCSGTSDGTL